MAPLRDHLVIVAKALLYLLAIVVASPLLLANPTSRFGALPGFVGVVLVAHALYRGDLGAVEYAVAGLYVVVIAVLAVAFLTALVSVPDVLTADSVVAVVLTTGLLVGYLGASSGVAPERSSPA